MRFSLQQSCDSLKNKHYFIKVLLELRVFIVKLLVYIDHLILTASCLLSGNPEILHTICGIVYDRNEKVCGKQSAGGGYVTFRTVCSGFQSAAINSTKSCIVFIMNPIHERECVLLLSVRQLTPTNFEGRIFEPSKILFALTFRTR